MSKPKTFSNTTASQTHENVPDVKTWGTDNPFKLISKAYSQEEKWMKSTKAMEIPNKGCIVQVTTQQGDNVAEALTYVFGVCIVEEVNIKGEVIGRSLISLDTFDNETRNY